MAVVSPKEGFTELTIVPLEEHIAAEVRGVAAGSPHGEETFAELRRALFRHSVLVFHDQDISDEQQVAFTRGFGRLQKTHDLVMWDNRTCLHRGRPWDNGAYKRIMHRTTLAGDGPTA